MSWITYKKEYMQPKIAKRKIEVIKVVKLEPTENGKYVMKPLLPFSFNDDTTYKLWDTVKRELDVSMEKTENMAFFKKHNIPRPEEFMKITSGLHCFAKKLKNALITVLPETEIPTVGIMTCYIPKGSTYYINEYDEIVTDTIIPESLFYTTLTTRQKEKEE